MVKGKSEREIRAAQSGGAIDSDQMQRSLLVVCSHTWPKAESSRKLEAAASERWENWWEQDERDERDQKLGPQTLPAIFCGLKQQRENQTVWGILGYRLMKFIHLGVNKEQRLVDTVQMVTEDFEVDSRFLNCGTQSLKSIFNSIKIL